MTTNRRQVLIDELQKLKANPKRSLGQNFLISNHVIDRIIAAATQLGKGATTWIEVGPGIGALTLDLIEEKKQRRFVLIELDRAFAERWRETALNVEALEVHEGDALKLDWQKMSIVAPALLVSNLPYQISSSLVIERCLQSVGIFAMVLMFQKEVAQRLRARPKTDDYGMLTVMAQAFWNMDLVCEAGPVDFFPPPRVASRVLSFQRKISLVDGFEREFLSFCKSAWSHRRKKLINNLGAFRKSEDISNVWVELNWDTNLRAEELSPDQFIHLFLQLQKI
jgi:16S rRNA (adenine1518-N6/adenine1519-N6)-dimethyltransferase